MRFDPEDYAFVAHYDQKRIAGQVKNLSKQALIRLFTVVIGIVVVVIIWWRNGKVSPSAWFGATRVAAIVLLVFLVVTAVVVIFEWFASSRASASIQVVVLAVLMVASGLLLFPVYFVASAANGYADPIRSFVGTLQEATDQTDYNIVKPLLTSLEAAHIGLLVCMGVAIAVLIAAIVLLIVWLSKPRSLGWRHRQVAVIALWVPPVLLMLCGALIAFAAWKTTDIQKKISEALPSTVALKDWLIWLLLIGMLVTGVTFIAGAARVAMAAILQQRVPFGNALRVDPLGMIVDDISIGPQRLVWPALDIIAGRPHGQLPGPELVIGRGDQPAWTVPFMYLDVMPGTIDSAVRAHTQDIRVLDLTPMDKVFQGIAGRRAGRNAGVGWRAPESPA